MNLYFGLFCSAGVLFNSSEIWFDFFCFCTIMLDKETWRKYYWFLFLICSLVWFLYTAKCEFSSKLRFYIKDWSPSRGSGATVGLIFPEIFVSPLSEFEQHMYSSDPRTDTGSLMQLESRRAVPQASQPPIIQSLSQDILIIPQLDGREVKNHCRLRDLKLLPFIVLFFRTLFFTLFLAIT